MRYDISYDPDRGRWYLDASWKQDATATAPTIDELRTGPVLGIDLNDGHLAACVLDGSGNPIGEPVSIEAVTAGLRASRRDGRVRAAITDLLDRAQLTGCGRSWWRTSTSLTRAPPAGKPSAAGNAESDCAAR